MTTNFVQQFEAFLSDRWWEIWHAQQRLVDEMQWYKSRFLWYGGQLYSIPRPARRSKTVRPPYQDYGPRWSHPYLKRLTLLERGIHAE